MGITFIGDSHPHDWVTGSYEVKAIRSVFGNIHNGFKNQRNIFINGTWFNPHITNNTNWAEVQELIQKGVKFDNLFFLTTIDPDWLDYYDFQKIVRGLGDPKVYRLGSQYDSEYAFNIFAIMMAKEFKQYSFNELVLEDIKYKFINYNRKPHYFRKELVRRIKEMHYDDHGLVSLGAGEGVEPVLLEKDVTKIQDDSGAFDTTIIPNDIMSLGRLEYWKHHFLNIVSETEFSIKYKMFISEKTFKPIIGLRPFLINGNIRVYDYLENNGFRTFDRYFEGNTRNPRRVHNGIMDAIHQICHMPNDELMSMYNDMLPDLVYNRARLFEFAKEQERKMQYCPALRIEI